MANSESLEERRALARADVRAAIKRVTKRIRAIDGDLERIAEGRALARNASWLVAAAAKAPRGSSFLTGTDWSSGEAKEVRIPLDPAKPPREQLEALFRKAKRLDGGEAVATSRREDSARALEALTDAGRRIEEAEDDDGIERAIADARNASPRDMPRVAAPGRRSKKDESLPPHRTFVASSGVLVLVGRGAARNDELTFQVARPHHLWLHARGVPGAHVIVPLKRNQPCPADLLIDAAHLAAHFSDARGEPIVEVTTAPRKWVRKPRGAAPGAVVVEREKVVTVRIEPARLKALLEAETALGK